MCTAEIAAFSNYSLKDTVFIIVIDAIFSARKQNWLWRWSELKGTKEARSIPAINGFSAFTLPTGENTCNRSVGLPFHTMKTFFKSCHTWKKTPLSVQL